MGRTTFDIHAPISKTYPLKVLGKLVLMMMFKMLAATPYLAQQHYRACPSLFSTFFHVMMMITIIMMLDVPNLFIERGRIREILQKEPLLEYSWASMKYDTHKYLRGTMKI